MARIKKEVRCLRLSWDLECYLDLTLRRGFLITEPPVINLDGETKKNMYGPRSPLFGTTYGDEQEFMDRTQCSCGAIKGKEFEGDICPLCGQPVEEKGTDIKYTGWIPLKNHAIIAPHYYRLLQKAIGKNVFIDMIYVNNKVDINGRTKRIQRVDNEQSKPLSEWSGIGIDGFQRQYKEIMMYFRPKRKNHQKLIDQLIAEESAVFAHHIPVYTTALRQQSITRSTFYFGKVDKFINTIVNLALKLTEAEEIEIPVCLERIQQKVNSLWETIFEDVNGKEGWIRDHILGGPINYTSRNVIIPDHTLHTDEVDLSYHTFLHLFYEKIIGYLVKSEGISMSEAKYQLKMASIKFDKKIYEAMTFLNKSEHLMILINRNPTLNYYSLLRLKIRRIIPDINSYVMALPHSILQGLNADFDGDVLNIIGLALAEIKALFRKFSPVKHMIMSRDNGLLNPYFTITKGQKIDLYYFATITRNPFRSKPNVKRHKIPKFTRLEDTLPVVTPEDFEADITKIPNIRTPEELEQFLRPLYIISDYFSSKKDYRRFQEKIYNIIKGCFERPDCREYKVKFKFYPTDKKTYELELRHFIINIFMWYPFITIKEFNALNENYIIDCYNDIPNIDNSINKVGNILREYQIKDTEVNKFIDSVIYNLCRISGDFSLIMNLTFGMDTIFQLYRDNPEFKDLMETQIDESAQPYEIEQLLSQKQQELITFHKSIQENPFGVILRSGTGFKDKQLTEFMVAQGLKPDLSGKTIPVPIPNSTLLKGLQKPSHLYIDANGARKSIVMSHKVMGKAGHFGKLMMECSRTLRLSTTVSDCHTKHFVTYQITDDKFLKKINGKFYKRNLLDRDWSIINYDRDKNLIGETVIVRSVATCALHNEVCAKCFGLTANLNFDIADGISGFESEEISKTINQNILSTKHLLTTNSEKIEFNEEFLDFFTIDSNEITSDIQNTPIDDIYDWVIEFDKLEKDDEFDSEESFNTYIVDGSFYVKNKTTGKKIHIQSVDNKELYLTDECLAIYKKHKNQFIPFSELEDDMVLFMIPVLNNELTAPLYTLMNLINKSDKSEIRNNIDYISQKFIELLIESRIDASAVAAEIIINRLIRDAENPLHRPDFSKNKLPNYVIYTVNRSLEYNESITTGLSHQFLKRQLENDNLNERTYPGYLDSFFREEVSTAPLKHLREEAEREIEEELEEQTLRDLT